MYLQTCFPMSLLILAFLTPTNKAIGELIVNDSLVFNLLAPREVGRSLYTEVRFDVSSHSLYSGFLLVISNRMRIDNDSCNLFGDMFALELNHRRVALSCSHYMVRYEPAPLSIRFLSALFINLTSKMQIVLTAVRFSCPHFHNRLRQCPNHPLYCISRSLFCDSVDNCGMRADEMDCVKSYEYYSRGAPTHSSIIEEKSPLMRQIHALFTIVLSIICVLLIGTLVLLIWKLKSNEKPTAVGQKTSICPKIEVTSENDGTTEGAAFSKKRSVVHKFMSSFKSQRTEVVNEAEETIALLSLGLKNVLYSLPLENFQSEEANGRIPARNCDYSASSSSSNDSISLFNEMHKT